MSGTLSTDRWTDEPIDLTMTGDLYGTNGNPTKNASQADKFAFSSLNTVNQFNLEHRTTHYGTNSQLN